MRSGLNSKNFTECHTFEMFLDIIVAMYIYTLFINLNAISK